MPENLTPAAGSSQPGQIEDARRDLLPLTAAKAPAGSSDPETVSTPGEILLHTAQIETTPGQTAPRTDPEDSRTEYAGLIDAMQPGNAGSDAAI